MDDPYITTVLPVIVPRHVLLHVTLHEALHPVTLAHIAHEFDRRAIYETKMFDYFIEVKSNYRIYLRINRPHWVGEN